MSLVEVDDFIAESEALYAILSERADIDLTQRTQFKGWTVEDVLVHLHFWNCAADLSLADETAFRELITEVMAAMEAGNLRAIENATIRERGDVLRDTWISHARDMAVRWREVDPKQRLPWVGPTTMSALSSISARQMETWAHGSEVFDLFGIERQEKDRIRNIVVLGVNTFGWSHKVHGLAVPPTMPHLELVAPSGAVWTFGDKSAGIIAGAAVDFAAVVTQTRALADTELTVEGDVARTWMAHAQCFAGPPEQPPAPRSRTTTASPAKMDLSGPSVTPRGGA